MARRSGAIPITSTRLRGRQRELGELATMLRTSHIRLITIVGAGGCGKTRLALEAASAARKYFPDGTARVGLGAIDDPALVPDEITRRLGGASAPEARSRQSTIEHLCRLVHDRRMLLVLDSFEHVADSADVVEELLESCPGLVVLVTSRRALGVYSEHGSASNPWRRRTP